jgi:hypothetical protein
MGQVEKERFQALFLSDYVEDAEALFEAIDTLPLSCSFTVKQLEDNCEIERGLYQRKCGQITAQPSPLLEANSFLAHLLDVIASRLRNEEPHKLLERRWQREVVRDTWNMEERQKHFLLSLSIANVNSHLVLTRFTRITFDPPPFELECIRDLR